MKCPYVLLYLISYKNKVILASENKYVMYQIYFLFYIEYLLSLEMKGSMDVEMKSSPHIEYRYTTPSV